VDNEWGAKFSSRARGVNESYKTLQHPKRPAVNSQSVSNAAAIHQALVVMVIFTNGGSDDAEWGGITEAWGALHSHMLSLTGVCDALCFFQLQDGAGDLK
jgi:hypothetical protein